MISQDIIQLKGYTGPTTVLYPIQLNAVLSGRYVYSRALGVSDSLYNACQIDSNKKAIDSTIAKIYNR